MKYGKVDESSLKRAKKYRDSGLFEEALAILHQLNVKYPDNISLLYLLASTYFEAGNDEAAIEYCDKTLSKDEKCEEAIELKAYIWKKNKEYKKSSELLNHLLNDINASNYNARKQLISLYCYYLKEYDKAEYHCKYLLDNKDVNRDSLAANQKELVFRWLSVILLMLKTIYILQKKYTEAAEVKEYDNRFLAGFHVLGKPYGADVAEVYILYSLAGNEEKAKEYEEKLNSEYSSVKETLDMAVDYARKEGFAVTKSEPLIINEYV